MALSTMAALVVLIIALMSALNFNKPDFTAETAFEEVVEPPTPSPEPPREMTVAYAMQQQELLQRDALKLGAHLRENLILFQVADK